MPPNFPPNSVHQPVAEDPNFGKNHVPDGRPIDRRFLLKDAAKTWAAALTVAGLTNLTGCSESDVNAPQPSSKPMTTEMSPITMLDAKGLLAILPERVHMVKMSDVMAHGCNCVDGRNPNPEGVVGLPGGDAGIIIAALTTLETKVGRPLTQEETDHVVSELSGTEYLHTDDHTLMGHGNQKGLLRTLVDDPVLKTYIPNVETAREIVMRKGLPKDAPEAVQTHYLDVVSQPEWQGCGHLKNVMQNPDAFGTRPELARNVIRASHKRIQAHDENHSIMLEPLPGNHLERAVAIINLQGEITEDTEIPAVEANAEKGGMIFVLHPRAAEPRLRQIASIVKGRFPDTDEAAFVAESMKTLESQTTQIALRLAKGRHQLVATLGEDGMWSVEDKGVIPA